ncbi:MAG: hypothetical protein V9E96_21245 [Chitinophagaceae bacterium]|jgi:hypothetical protein|nr:hypothetical protein [Chitinophagaceae bacterium]
MRLAAIAFFLLFVCISYAQNNKVVQTKNGIELTYEIKKVDSGSKKTKYSIVVTAINKNSNALYYETSPSYSSEFVSIKIDNSTGLFKDYVDLKGEKTSFKVENNKELYKIEENKEYTQSKFFNVKTGETPIVSVKYNDGLKKFEDFKIEVFTKDFIDGLWKTECGNNNILLTLNTVLAKTTILQTSNGKQIKWIETSPNIFVKETDVNTILIFNKQNKRFIYTTTEGITMEWIKQ